MSEAAPWSLDREVVIVKVVSAPRPLVFAAWTSAEHISKWFGPNGFTTTTREMDVRVGGRWCFDFTGPDGTPYSNRVVYREIVKDERLVFDHGSDVDGDPDVFRVTVTFDSQSDGKTVVTLRQMHPSKERRAAVVAFGAVEYGLQTLSKLAEHVTASA